MQSLALQPAFEFGAFDGELGGDGAEEDVEAACSHVRLQMEQGKTTG
jgi:hypothetical protein